MKRILAFLLAAAMVLCLGACGNNTVSDEQFAEDMKELLGQGVELVSDVYLGEGLEAQVPENAQIDPYAETAYFPVAECEYKSVDDIKNATCRIFSTRIAESWLYPDGFGTDTPLYRETDGVLEIDIFGGPLTAFGVEWQFDTLVITEKTEKTAKASVKKYINDYEEVEAQISFVNTADGWRIDSALY